MMQLIKVDNQANIIINKTPTNSEVNKAIAVVKTPTNGYFIGGYTLDGSLLVLKLDSNGNQIFKKIFGTKNYDKMNNLILLNDGGVLSVGFSSTSRSKNDPIFETGLGLNDIYLSRFSKNGKKLWSKKYGTQYDDKGIDAVEADDGSIIIVSTTEYNKNQNITLMRIDENGNKIWLNHYKKENKVTPHKVIKLRDNNFLLSLSKQNEMNKEQIRLIKFNLQKDIIDDKEIYTSYSSVLKDIQEYSDGSFIGVGYVQDTYNTDALVMMIDNKLNMVTQAHYGDENYDIFNAVAILHNSQAGAAGIHTNKYSQESNMWIAKINRDATLSQISTNIDTFYKQLLKIFKTEIDANKLIIKEDLSLEFTDKTLLFQVGKYKLTALQKEFLSKFSTKLIPFLKTNKELISTIEINGHTSSEWGGTDFTNTYLKNEKLSMNRSYSTLSNIFTSQNKPTQVWLSKVLKGSGLSYSKKIEFADVENKIKSRRVSFKILLQNL
jgi:outer membrane protein OmpA-like peptidoglycan-associated protein